jgi:hypothetical protein
VIPIRSFCGLCVLVLLLSSSSCSLNGLAADSAASMAKAAEPHMRGFWDYEIAGAGIAQSIMQLEALHAISPDNEQLSLVLASSHVGYAFGWLEVQIEQAEDAGRVDEATGLRQRAELLYRRARDLAVGVMRYRDDGIDAALAAKPEVLKRYLQEHYTDAEDDVAPVFWAASAWGSLMNMTEDMGQMIALPTVRTLVEHSVSLNPAFEMAGGVQFLGGFLSQFPAQMGGSPARGQQYFEQALQLTKRKAHIVLVNYARLYALTLNDKPLFLKLLREVIEAGDQGRPYRLSNKIARVRAELLLAKADQLL